MGSLFGGGGGGGSTQPVKPPKPIQLNLGSLQSNAIGADQAAYGQQDQYMQQFYPDLWNAQQNMIGSAYQNLTGPLPSPLENAFVTQGNMGSAQALGGGDQGFGLSKGSLARNSAAATLASQEQGYQDYNRAEMEQLNNAFAPRTFGLTPEDAANIFTFNNTQLNNYKLQQQAAATQSYYANQGAGAASSAATTGLIGSIGSAALSAAIPAIIA